MLEWLDRGDLDSGSKTIAYYIFITVLCLAVGTDCSNTGSFLLEQVGNIKTRPSGFQAQIRDGPAHAPHNEQICVSCRGIGLPIL